MVEIPKCVPALIGKSVLESISFGKNRKYAACLCVDLKSIELYVSGEKVQQ